MELNSLGGEARYLARNHPDFRIKTEFYHFWLNFFVFCVNYFMSSFLYHRFFTIIILSSFKTFLYPPTSSPIQSSYSTFQYTL